MPDGKSYHIGREGNDTASKVICMVENGQSSYELTPGASQKVWNHSPDGFNYGYGGSGPAQLALAILLDYLPTKEQAIQLYQRFKFGFLASVSQSESLTITSNQIEDFLKGENNAK